MLGIDRWIVRRSHGENTDRRVYARAGNAYLSADVTECDATRMVRRLITGRAGGTDRCGCSRRQCRGCKGISGRGSSCRKRYSAHRMASLQQALHAGGSGCKIVEPSGATSGNPAVRARHRFKSFLVLFFKKELLPSVHRPKPTQLCTEPGRAISTSCATNCSGVNGLLHTRHSGCSLGAALWP